MQLFCAHYIVMIAKKLFVLWFKKFWNMIFVLMAAISVLKYYFNSSCIHCFQYVSILENYYHLMNNGVFLTLHLWFMNLMMNRLS